MALCAIRIGLLYLWYRISLIGVPENLPIFGESGASCHPMAPEPFFVTSLANASRMRVQRYVKHLPFSKFFLHFFQKKISPPLTLAGSPTALVPWGALNLSPHRLTPNVPRGTFTHSHIHTSL